MLGYLRHRGSGPCETTNQTSVLLTGSGRVVVIYIFHVECPLSINLILSKVVYNLCSRAESCGTLVLTRWLSIVQGIYNVVCLSQICNVI